MLLDAVLEEAVEHKADVTAYPVELGADINDHVILQPMRYTMTSGVTDTPTTYRDTNYVHPDASLRSKAAWALLVDLMAERVPFGIQTGYLLYENMVIDGLSSSKKGAAHDSAIFFEASLIQLNIVSTSVSSIDDAVRSAAQAAGSDGQADAGAGPILDNGNVKPKTLLTALLDPGGEFISDAAEAAWNADLQGQLKATGVYFGGSP